MTATRARVGSVSAAPRGRRAARGARLPSALWVCVLLAILNSATWAVTTPSFQVIDEIVHTGYVQYFAESGSLPKPVATGPGVYDFGQEQGTAITGVPFTYQSVPNWLEAADDDLERRLAEPLEREHEPGAGTAANNPPLYYVLEAIPYKLASSGNFLDRVLAMRLFSTLFIGATVGFVFLFLRELLPRTPWAWTVGALAVAFQPVVAWAGGGVNPDSLLWAASAALIWLLTRALNRGLSVRLALGIGASVTAGLLTKAAMLGLIPGAAIGVLLAAVKTWRSDRRQALVGVVVAGVAALLPYVLYTVVSRALAGQPTAAAAAVSSGPGNVREQIVYLWQFFLPKLPFMKDEFPGYPMYPLWQTYFQGFVGRFGYFSFGFPDWVSGLALVLVIPLLGLLQASLMRSWDALKRRKAQLVTFLALLGGTVLLVGIAGFRFRAGVGLNFEQPRYLFPVIALYGALVAIAARGAGRFGPAVGAALVMGAVGHNLFALLLSLARYYS